MRTPYCHRRFGFGLVLASFALGSAALAQGPGGPLPGSGPPPPPPPGGPRELTAVNIPLEALQAPLKLTAAQKEKIAQIQQQFHEQMRREMPPPPGGPGGER